MKKFLAILSLMAIVGCSCPVSAHEFHHGNYHYGYSHHRPPMRKPHPVVVHHYNDYYWGRPPRRHYYYSNHYHMNKTGAVLTGIAAGAIITGIFASIAD